MNLKIAICKTRNCKTRKIYLNYVVEKPSVNYAALGTNALQEIFNDITNS